MEELFAFLDRLYPLSPELQAALITRFHKETFRKNRPLLAVGQVCDWLAFIERGLVKVCYDVPGGDERIVAFGRGGEMVCGVKSYVSAAPSRVSVVAVEETVVRRVRRAEVEAVVSRFPVFGEHVRRILDLGETAIEDHYLLIGMAPRARFEKLVVEGSWVLSDRRVRQYMAAGYLGVDQATLSRWVRGKG